MIYNRGFEIYKCMFDIGQIHPAEIILVRSKYPNIEDRGYFIVSSKDRRTKYQLEDLFGRVAASKILRGKEWLVKTRTIRLK